MRLPLTSTLPLKGSAPLPSMIETLVNKIEFICLLASSENKNLRFTRNRVRPRFSFVARPAESRLSGQKIHQFGSDLLRLLQRRPVAAVFKQSKGDRKSVG